MIRSLVVLSCLTSVALAQPGNALGNEVMPADVVGPTKVTDAKAKALVRALKLAGVKAKVVKRTWTYTARTISCDYTPDPAGGYVDDGDGLGTATCQIDGKKYAGAAAAVLVQGMHDAEIPEPYRMGDKKLVRANAVTCTIEQTKRGAEGPWSCTFTPVGR